MSNIDKFVEKTFDVKCKGRNSKGNNVLMTGEIVHVNIYKSPGSNSIESQVRCKYNCGSHGDECSASYQHLEKKPKKRIGCPYSFDVPYALEKNKEIIHT
jgi:hypothetical protein